MLGKPYERQRGIFDIIKKLGDVSDIFSKFIRKRNLAFGPHFINRNDINGSPNFGETRAVIIN